MNRRDFTTGTLAQAVALGTLNAALPALAASRAAAPGSKSPMKTYRIPQTDLKVSRIGYGCAYIGGSWDRQPVSANTVVEAERQIHTAYEHGITLFDHADMYCYGKSEAVFGQILKKSPGLREQVVLQSKCGEYVPETARPNDPQRLDFSYSHIVEAVEGSLRRLQTDRLDILLLHRPDALVEPDEVARAFDELQRGGKVRYFGVSNHTPAQIELLKKSVRQPLVINQVQLGLAQSSLIVDGLEFNRSEGKRLTSGYAGAAGGLDYCRLHDIQVQAWEPLRGVPLKPVPADAAPEMKRLADLLQSIANDKSATPAAVALAWLLRHPAGILPLTSSRNPDHLVENCAADRIELSRAEWYALLMAGGGFGPVA